jgi:PEP-CTERM motif
MSISARWAGDRNTVIPLGQDDSLQFVYWEETYRENSVVSNATPGGSGIANAPGEPGCPSEGEPCYFDKIISLDGEVGTWELVFGVSNRSPFNWSGFFLEIFDSSFDVRLSNVLLDAQNGAFPIRDLRPDAVWFSGGVQHTGPHYLGNSVRLSVDLDQVGPSGSFGIRQTATPVLPEPGTFALLGLGLLGLRISRRHRVVLPHDRARPCAGLHVSAVRSIRRSRESAPAGAPATGRPRHKLDTAR